MLRATLRHRWFCLILTWRLCCIYSIIPLLFHKTANQLHVALWDCNPLSVNGSKLGAFENLDHIILDCLSEGLNNFIAQTEIHHLKILQNFRNQASKWSQRYERICKHKSILKSGMISTTKRIRQKQTCWFLISSNVPQSYNPRLIPTKMTPAPRCWRGSPDWKCDMFCSCHHETKSDVESIIRFNNKTKKRKISPSFFFHDCEFSCVRSKFHQTSWILLWVKFHFFLLFLKSGLYVCWLYMYDVVLRFFLLLSKRIYSFWSSLLSSWPRSFCSLVWFVDGPIGIRFFLLLLKRIYIWFMESEIMLS